MRVGIVLGALWLCLPTKTRPAAWAAIAARPERGLSDQITHDNFERLRDRADELAAKLAALRTLSRR